MKSQSKVGGDGVDEIFDLARIDARRLVMISSSGAVRRSECIGTAAADTLSDVIAAPDGVVWVTGTAGMAAPASRQSSASTPRDSSEGTRAGLARHELARRRPPCVTSRRQP